MIYCTLDPGDTRKGLYLHIRVAIVSPLRSPPGQYAKAAQSISRKVACLHNPSISRFLAVHCE